MCTVINIDQTEQKSWPIFSDTSHSSRVGVDNAEKVALLARLALEAGTSNLGNWGQITILANIRRICALIPISPQALTPISVLTPISNRPRFLIDVTETNTR